MEGIGWWFCCLNPREREVLRATIEGLALTLYVGIPLSLWDGFWLIYLYHGAAMRAAFLDIYRLEIVEIELGEPPVPVQVVRPLNESEYVDWLVFILTPDAACVDGCQQSKLPNSD